jgi:hypothetical protein
MIKASSIKWIVKTAKTQHNVYLRVVRQDDNSKILVVTPLYEGHKISKETKKSIKRNKYPFTWIKAEGKNNIPINAFGGVDWFLHKTGSLPDYYIMIDRDIRLGRGMLDRLYDKLYKSPQQVAYSYASFKFTGAVNRDFPADPWDINKLLMHNYISSNSMFRTNVLYEVGLVMDSYYKRLLDWAFLLKLFYSRKYVGVPCPEAKFEATSNHDSISAGGNDDYNIKRMRIIEDFCKPIMIKHAQQQEAVHKTAQVTPTTMDF